jgi:hypothetical protein
MMTSEADDPRAGTRPTVRPDGRPESRDTGPAPSGAFAEILKNADELLRLARLTAAALATRQLGSWDGFSALLNSALPPDPAVDIRLARAVRLADDTVTKLRQRAVSPASVAPEPLSRLAQAMRLDWPVFDALIRRDLAWFSDGSALGVLRGVGLNANDVSESLRAAWQRASEDAATGL